LGLRKTAFVYGDSMLPTLKAGDIVFFKKYKKNKSILKNRQIVIFNHPIKNKNLIKRINSVNQNYVEVIGDNIEFSEDSNKFGLINNEKIIGIVTSKLIIPKLKNFLIQKNRSTSLNPK
jgi:signal peptidase I